MSDNPEHEKSLAMNLLKMTVLAVVFIMSLSCSSYPSRQEVETFWNEFRSAAGSEERTGKLVAIIDRMGATDSKTDSDELHKFFVDLNKYYRETDDSSVLEALERVRLVGEVSMETCGFYCSISDSTAFQKRYANSKSKDILRSRCVGISGCDEKLPN